MGDSAQQVLTGDIITLLGQVKHSHQSNDIKNQSPADKLTCLLLCKLNSENAQSAHHKHAGQKQLL
jgi:hypothetical protein